MVKSSFRGILMGDLKEQAIRIFLRTLDAIEISGVLDRKVRVDGDSLIVGDSTIDLGGYREVVAVGLGKASVKMAQALVASLGDRVTRGVVVIGEQGIMSPGPQVEVVVGGHP